MGFTDSGPKGTPRPESAFVDKMKAGRTEAEADALENAPELTEAEVEAIAVKNQEEMAAAREAAGKTEAPADDAQEVA
ncbi:hypothetical protein HN358_01535 [Candidatus Uhrbacteria bacterium]|jgi:hypothetical protein|nr:hypothetical protein [Candidatus Uhrbacteria bacterium]MBT7717288.1 hypothetical protein [Candidatus Uhrbacteria bacterium]